MPHGFTRRGKGREMIQVLVRPVKAGITASTTQTQAAGVKLIYGFNEIHTVANTSDACTLPKAPDGSVQLTCDLATLAVPGTYTIVATYTYVAGCVNAANAATCQSGGVVSSTPFVLTRVASPVLGPVLRVSP